MLTPYQIIRSKKHSSPRQSLTPKQNLLSFTQQQQISRHISQSRHRFKRIANITHQNETETESKMVRLSKEDDHLERVVRGDPKKNQNFRFTFTESHIPTEQGKIGPDSNIRLVIQGDHCRKDLLKLNRRKLEAMIAKIREGKTDLNGPPCTIADVVLQKCQPRTRAFFIVQPRKSQDWKAHMDDSVSPKQFDTRQFLICHSVRQEKRESSRGDDSISNKKTIVSPKKDEKRMGWSSYSKFSEKKYRRNQPKGTCRTQQKLKKSSLSLLHHSPSFKRIQTTNSFNANTLKGWQPSHQRQSFFWQTFTLEH